MADEQRFTPGPWYVRRTSTEQVREANYIDIVNVPEGRLSEHPGGWLIAEIDAEHPVDEANARLLAAAPEMYEALKPFANMFISWTEEMECIADDKPLFDESFDGAPTMGDVRKAQALIAKIDGKEQE